MHDPNLPEDVLKVDADEDGVGGPNCSRSMRPRPTPRVVGACRERTRPAGAVVRARRLGLMAVSVQAGSN
jgi:hypothetical protein